MGFDAGKAQLDALKNGRDFRTGRAESVWNRLCVGDRGGEKRVLQAGNEAEVNTGYVWVTKENMNQESIRKMLYE